MVLDLKQKNEAASIYVPEIATIKKTRQMSPTEKLFDIEIDNPESKKAFDFLPGQFVELTVFGLGEAPFSIPSSPNNKDYFQLCIRDIGNVSGALHRMKPGE